MKSLIYRLAMSTLAVFLLSFWACSPGADATDQEGETASATSTIQITPLKPRSGKVGTPEEYNRMSNTYTSLRQQIEQNPQDYPARLKMADLYIVEARATGDYGYYYPAAISMIDGVLAENPPSEDDQFRALTSKAVILLSQHKFEEAREMGERALAINDHTSRVYGILTDAYVELGDYDKAVETADSMVALRPDLRSYSRISYLREIFGEVEGAKEAMEMAVKAGAPGYEETVWSRVTLGNLHEKYGELDKAEMQYRLALQERPAYPFATQGLASVEAKKGNLDTAEMLLTAAIEIRPEASFYEDLALLYRRMKREEDEAEAREEAFAFLRGLEGSHSHDDGEHAHDHDGHEHDHAHADGSSHSHDHGHDDGEHAHDHDGHEHDHAHADGSSHSHDHDHGHGEHDHDGHEHDHAHADGSSHSHDHGHDDGEHAHDHDGHEHDHGGATGSNSHGHSHEVGLEMANAYLHLTGNYEKALENARHEFERRPDNIEVNKALAEIYLKMGRLELADQHYERATRTNTRDPELMAIGGLIHLRNNERPEGQRLIKKAFETDPYLYMPEAKAYL